MGRPGSVDTAGQILSNYQAALHLLEHTGTDLDRAVLQRAATDVFTTVRDACARSPDLDELVSQVVAEPARADVAAERQRIAAVHSRLIRRRPAVHEETAGRLAELAAGSHSAGALFLELRASALDGAHVDGPLEAGGHDRQPPLRSCPPRTDRGFRTK